MCAIWPFFARRSSSLLQEQRRLSAPNLAEPEPRPALPVPVGSAACCTIVHFRASSAASTSSRSVLLPLHEPLHFETESGMGAIVTALLGPTCWATENSAVKPGKGFLDALEMASSSCPLRRTPQPRLVHARPHATRTNRKGKPGKHFHLEFTHS